MYCCGSCFATSVIICCALGTDIRVVVGVDIRVAVGLATCVVVGALYRLLWALLSIAKGYWKRLSTTLTKRN